MTVLSHRIECLMDTKTWLGTSMDDMGRGNGMFNFDVPCVLPSKYHAVLFELPINLSSPPKPYHNAQVRHWDDDHVRMPYSANNLFPVKDDTDEENLKSRWEIIQVSLLQPISTSRELEAAINKYNTHIPKFLALHHFFEEVLDGEESEIFFKTLLPGIIQLALQLPDILPGNVPLLKKGTCKSVSLSQLQIASLLANGFLCTFPWRKDISATYPGVNFIRLFAAHSRPKRVNCVAEKLKCIFHYFRRVLSKTPVGIVTFDRKFLHKNQVPRWDRLENNLGNTRIHVTSTGTIEDSGHWLLQVDFANKFVGGGTLGYGCVQEEIRYVICPELIISRLFTEELGPLEALVVTGIERYSNYSGYGDLFTWNGDCQDEAPFDKFGRRKTSVVAMDALKFNKPLDQFYVTSILRELNKAYVGFHSRLEGKLAPVATGNWGCGAFKGDPKLKSVLQLMACSAANRNMVYYTFGDSELQETIYNIHTFLAVNKVTICQLWRLLCRFVAAQLKHTNFFPYIQQAYFDSKNQPSIIQAFSFNQKKESLYNKPQLEGSSSKTVESNRSRKCLKEDSTPSTSSDINCLHEIMNTTFSELSDSDIVESSQPEETAKLKFEKSKKELRKKHNDIIDLINIIDDETSQREERKQAQEESKLETDFVSIDMDIGGLFEDTSEDIVGMETVQHKLQTENSGTKRRITDYFVKIYK